MRQRNRRGRMLTFGLIFLALNIYSATVRDASASSPDDKDNTLDGVTPRDDDLPTSRDAVTTNADIDASVTPTATTNATTTTTKATTTTTTIQTPLERRGRYRPKRNCTPPAIEQFPPPILPPSFRERGGLIIHILIAIFTFLGLAIVCDDYFVASLDRICEGIKICFIFQTSTY